MTTTSDIPTRGEVPPSDTDIQDTMFAPGEAAEHPFGVLYQGEFETPHDGTCVAVRKHALALAATGLPVLLKSFSNTVISGDGVPQAVHNAGLDPEIKALTEPLRMASVATTVPMIKHAVVHTAEHLRNLTVPRGVIFLDPEQLISHRNAILRSTILYSVWERDRIDPAMALWLNRLGECWVPCEQNQRMLVSSGVQEELVRVVPHPFDPNDPLNLLLRRRARPGKDFYSIGRWEPRKGYYDLVGAFVLAFKPGEAATLTIKTGFGSWDGYPTPEATVNHWLGHPTVHEHGWTRALLAKHLRIIRGALPVDQLLKLHYEHNIYVACSHGEAWCLPAFDAKTAGNTLVHVPYGGTQDFADPNTDAKVPYRLGPVDPSYRWEADAQWAEYDVEELAAKLLAVQTPAEFCQPPGFAERFSMKRVGELMRDRVLEVAARCARREVGDYLKSQLQEKEHP